MKQQPSSETTAFVQQLTASQSRLYAYICTLLGRATGANDVLQETNLVLWQKVDEFDSTRPFLPWAYRFAYHQVLSYRKRCSRNRMVLNQTVIDQVSQDFLEANDDLDEQLEALDGCLQKLSAQHQNLVKRRYHLRESVQQIATDLGQAANTVAAQLFRIRKSLSSCIEGRLSTESTS